MLNIIIPMAGEGKRLDMYDKPKLLIDINGKTMMQRAIECVTPSCPHRFIFVVRQEHIDKYEIDKLLFKISPDCIIISVNKNTDGQADSLLGAEKYIDNDDELIQSNCDHYCDIDFDDFVSKCRDKISDGTIMTFYSTDPKYSFSRIGSNGWIAETAEKKCIGPYTNAIIYYKHGKDCVRGIKTMIEKGVKVNGEYYVNPSINELILEGRKFKVYNITSTKFYCFGDKETLEKFKKTEVSKR